METPSNLHYSEIDFASELAKSSHYAFTVEELPGNQTQNALIQRIERARRGDYEFCHGTSEYRLLCSIDGRSCTTACAIAQDSNGIWIAGWQNPLDQKRNKDRRIYGTDFNEAVRKEIERYLRERRYIQE